METGDLVKMSEELKNGLISNGCEDHVKEFGDCVGRVEGLVYPNGEGNELNVRWLPSKLRYGYPPECLIKVEQEISKSMNEFLDRVDELCFQYGYEIKPSGDTITINPTINIDGDELPIKLLYIDGDGRGK